MVLLILALVCCGKLAQSCLLPIWCLPLQLHGAHLGCISQWVVCPHFCIWCMAWSLSSCLGLSAFISESSMSQVELLKCYLLGACSLSEKSMSERGMSGIDILLCKCLWMAYPWTCGTQCPTTAWEDVSQRFVHTKKVCLYLAFGL